MEEAQKMLKHTKLSIIIKKKKKGGEREKKLMGNMEFVITYLHCTTNMGCLKKNWKEINITAQLKKKRSGEHLMLNQSFTTTTTLTIYVACL